MIPVPWSPNRELEYPLQPDNYLLSMRWNCQKSLVRFLANKKQRDTCQQVLTKDPNKNMWIIVHVEQKQLFTRKTITWWVSLVLCNLSLPSGTPFLKSRSNLWERLKKLQASFYPLIFSRCGSPGASAFAKLAKYQNLAKTQKLPKRPGPCAHVHPPCSASHFLAANALKNV